MEKMMRHEIEAAAREILEYLESYGDTPVLLMKDHLGKPELYYYMGLGDLILQHRVSIQECQGAMWAIRSGTSVKAA